MLAKIISVFLPHLIISCLKNPDVEVHCVEPWMLDDALHCWVDFVHFAPIGSHFLEADAFVLRWQNWAISTSTPIIFI